MTIDRTWDKISLGALSLSQEGHVFKLPARALIYVACEILLTSKTNAHGSNLICSNISILIISEGTLTNIGNGTIKVVHTLLL